MRWVWRPESCRVESFDARAFFRAFDSKFLLVAGDSLSIEFHSSLRCQLGGTETWKNANKTIRVLDVCQRLDAHLHAERSGHLKTAVRAGNFGFSDKFWKDKTVFAGRKDWPPAKLKCCQDARALPCRMQTRHIERFGYRITLAFFQTKWLGNVAATHDMRLKGPSWRLRAFWEIVLGDQWLNKLGGGGVVALNTGLHWHGMPQQRSDNIHELAIRTRSAMDGLFTDLQKSHPRRRYWAVYRTSATPIEKCVRFKQPLTWPEFLSKTPASFNWAQLYHWDAHFRGVFSSSNWTMAPAKASPYWPIIVGEQSEEPGQSVVGEQIEEQEPGQSGAAPSFSYVSMNALTLNPLARRGSAQGGNGDCGHGCLPGPFDVMADFLWTWALAFMDPQRP